VAGRFWLGRLLCGIRVSNEVWVGEDGDSPHPLGVCPPSKGIGCWMAMRMRILPSRFRMPLKRIFIGSKGCMSKDQSDRDKGLDRFNS
jgi:hypothetical protein